MTTTDRAGGLQISPEEYIRLFSQFSKEEQLKIAEQLALQTFQDRWMLLDEELPDTDDLSEEEIMAEIHAVRKA